MVTAARSNVLSNQAQLALRAERSEARADQVGKAGQSSAIKHVFWNKWSQLSTGQKWGRALSWLLPPLGLGLHAAAQMWQGRQAKVVAARPTQTASKLSEAMVNDIPIRSMTTFGASDRQAVGQLFQQSLDLGNPEVKAGSGLAASADMVGLPERFAKDILRNQSHQLQSADGKQTVKLLGQSQDPAADFRAFFNAEFAEDPVKAKNWTFLAATYMNQMVSVAVNAQSGQIKGFRATTQDQHHSYSLKMEGGGNSALLEARSVGAINNLAGTAGRLAAAKRDFDPKSSNMEEVALLRLHLGPPQRAEVVSCQTRHQFAIPKGPLKPMSEAEEIAPPPQPSASSLSDGRVNTLKRYIEEEAVGARDRPDLDTLKQEVQERKRVLTPEQEAVFKKYWNQSA